MPCEYGPTALGAEEVEITVLLMRAILAGGIPWGLATIRLGPLGEHLKRGLAPGSQKSANDQQAYEPVATGDCKQLEWLSLVDALWQIGCGEKRDPNQNSKRGPVSKACGVGPHYDRGKDER